MGGTGDATSRARVREDNAHQRQMTALDLRSQGYTFDVIAARCGFAHRSAARRAWQAAIKAIAEDTAEEARLLFKASYGPVRQALHNKARMGDVRAVEALVKLDERECRLFGLDLTPTDAMLSVQYTKRIVLEEVVESLPVVPPDPTLEHHENGSAA
jgi:AraC-like DNA-binding protein